MYDHKKKQYGPGTVWEPQNKESTGDTHLVTPNNLLALDNYHLFVKCAYARAYVQRVPEILFWAEIYDKMQVRRVGYSKRNEFNKLLDSFLMGGFDNHYPIPVAANYKILDGSHRVAASFACKENPLVEVYTNEPHSYDRHWFELVGFTGSELAAIDSFQTEIFCSYKESSDLRVAIVWGSALDYWAEILSLIDRNNLASAVHLELNDSDKVRKFVELSYQGDGAIMEKIIDKGIRLSSLSTKVGIITLCETSAESARILKSIIREKISKRMKNYFFDNIIHIIDCPETTFSILSEYSQLTTRRT